MAQDTTISFDDVLHITSSAGLDFDDAVNIYTALALGGIGGSGTTDTIAKFTATSTFGNSNITDNNDVVTINKRTRVTTDLIGADGQHAGLQVLCNGTALTSNDGGLQSFQQSTYNCTSAPAQSIAVYAGNTCSKSAGANTLNNYGVFSSAANGTNNYSFYGLTGLLQNVEGALFGTTTNGVTVGSGSVAAAGNMQVNVPLTVANTQTVSLGNNVAGFQIPGSTSTDPRILLSGGVSGAASECLVTKNTATGSTLSGISMAADTTVNANVSTALMLWRGAGGGIGGANNVGMAIVGNAGSFITGTAVNDGAIYNTAVGKKLCFSSDGSGFTMGAALDTNGVVCAKKLQVGTPSAMTGAVWASGTGSPEGVVTGNKGDLWSRTDGGAGTCFYVKETTGGNTGWVAK